MFLMSIGIRRSGLRKNLHASVAVGAPYCTWMDALHHIYSTRGLVGVSER